MFKKKKDTFSVTATHFQNCHVSHFNGQTSLCSFGLDRPKWMARHWHLSVINQLVTDVLVASTHRLSLQKVWLSTELETSGHQRHSSASCHCVRPSPHIAQQSHATHTHTFFVESQIFSHVTDLQRKMCFTQKGGQTENWVTVLSCWQDSLKRNTLLTHR